MLRGGVAVSVARGAYRFVAGGFVHPQPSSRLEIAETVDFTGDNDVDVVEFGSYLQVYLWPGAKLRASRVKLHFLA